MFTCCFIDAVGKEVLPVIVSLRENGQIKQEVLKKATELQIPIIHFMNENQTNTQDSCVLWATNSDKDEAEIIQYKTVALTEMPWRIQKLEEKYTQGSSLPDGIAFISEINGDLDDLIYNMILGVCLEKESLSITGRYVFNEKYLKTVWNNQTSFSKIDYPLPEYRVQNSQESDNTEQTVNKSNGKETKVKLTNWESECYGLIFFALLQKQYWEGALQLLENGYIGINHILVGCVIVEDEINKGKTEKLLTEKLKRIQKAFTDKAVSITSYIYEEDKKKKNEIKKKITDSPERKENNERKKAEQQLADNVSHAGRLLLNHGYLRDAINTENNAYLESETVKKILNKILYGTEEVHRQSAMCFFVLSAVHIIVLPLLMINMEYSLLRWFYKKYQLHYVKVYIHMLGYTVLLIAYSYMLLFDYKSDGISYTDYFIIIWMASFFVDETNQIIVAVIRDKWTNYSIDWWNLLDWLMIALYTTGMLLKTGEGTGFQITSKLLLVVTFTALCTRLLHFTCMTEFLGRKLVINRKMIKDTSAFMIIILIIMVWYSVSFYALLYENSDFTWKQMEKILRNGYWMLFGDLYLDATEIDCTSNRTIYEMGILQRCPSDLGVYVTPYLKAFYGLLAVVLLLNLLIAMYSDTYTKVQQNANLSWLQMQIDLFEEYSIKTVFPIHLQLFALVGTIPAILWFCFYYLRIKFKFGTEKENRIKQRAMLVRVFLYDTSYDVKHKSTLLAEEKGVLEAKGKIDLSDSDAVTTLTKLTSIEDELKNVKTMLIKTQKDMEDKLDKMLKKLKIDKDNEQTSF
ncbi:uncharacterized protein LOC134692272 [Mytilus trossulus]|uniref:uncharacterized protein LOC134692272 n=1 Tax=Mytilus trossulus TaxID=6551 RepID=UPI003006EA60